MLLNGDGLNNQNTRHQLLFWLAEEQIEPLVVYRRQNNSNTKIG
jgi:hypothetical protein